MSGRLIVLGGGGHAKVLISLIRKLGLEVIGYTDLADRGTILSAPFLGSDRALADLVGRYPDSGAAMGLGKIDVSSARTRLLGAAKSQGLSFPVLVSPQAIVNEEVQLGEGTAIFDGAVVNSGSRIGGLCIVNTSSTVEHDCRLGQNTHIAPGAVVSGGVIIGDDCMIGAGSVVLQEIKVCSGCLVGAGSVVTRDLLEPGVYAGVPARRIR
jgi:sugar O-acyltransferase (sialic acid O-acetyltransferase NeuD family)